MIYKTVTGNRLIDDEVNKLIKQGYKPQGGVSITNIDGKFWMSQALVKPAKKSTKQPFKLKPGAMDDKKPLNVLPKAFIIKDVDPSTISSPDRIEEIRNMTIEQRAKLAEKRIDNE